MARKYGRLWSVAVASTLFLLILTSLHYYNPSRVPSPPAVSVDEQGLEQDSGEASLDLPPLEKPPKEPEDVVFKAQPVTTEEFTVHASSSTLLDDTQTTPDTQPTQAFGKEEVPSNATTTASQASEPTPTETTKIIVAGRLKSEDTNWIVEHLGEWQNAIYYVDLLSNETSPTGLRTKMNKAREAMPYLTYIVEHYPDFPDVVAFIHPHRNGMPAAWHTDSPGHDGVNMMNALRLETVLDRGYVNLRCNNEVGCPSEIQPYRDPPDPKLYTEHAYPYVYAHFFNKTQEEMREEIKVVATPCCAQFAVSKAQLLKKPKEEYVKYKTFLEETEYDDATSGRVMEYMWHIIFGRDAVHCDNIFECYCNVYGKCSRIWQRDLKLGSDWRFWAKAW